MKYSMRGISLGIISFNEDKKNGYLTELAQTISLQKYTSAELDELEDIYFDSV